jgi:SAM-dependent methyltransferase
MALRGNELAHSFGNVATEYNRLRSGPPAAAVDWLIGTGISVAVELGAGTGIMSRMLGERIPELYPIEPDPRMREVFANCWPGRSALAGSAEEIPLPDHSVDAVFSADAWHWFDPATACREIARVLRPGGVLGVTWNLRDSSVAWTDDLFAILDTKKDPARPPGLFKLPADAGFTAPQRHDVRWTRQLSRSEVMALLGTYSPVIALSESERTALHDRLYEYMDTHPELAGREVIDVPFSTACFRARLESDGTGTGAVRTNVS